MVKHRSFHYLLEGALGDKYRSLIGAVCLESHRSGSRHTLISTHSLIHIGSSRLATTIELILRTHSRKGIRNRKSKLPNVFSS